MLKALIFLKYVQNKEKIAVIVGSSHRYVLRKKSKKSANAHAKGI